MTMYDAPSDRDYQQPDPLGRDRDDEDPDNWPVPPVLEPIASRPVRPHIAEFGERHATGDDPAGVDDSLAMLLVTYMALAAGLEITEQDRARELANAARIYLGAGCTIDEARVAMRQTWHREGVN